jgi:hypothetical protein
MSQNPKHPARLWMSFADCGEFQPLHIRQWQSTPFDGGFEYVLAASQEAAAPSEAVDRSMLARARDWMADNIRERDIEGATVLGYLALFLKASPAPVAAAPSEEPVAIDLQRIRNCSQAIRSIHSGLEP